jgi:hypothetical protein
VPGTKCQALGEYFCCYHRKEFIERDRFTNSGINNSAKNAQKLGIPTALTINVERIDLRIDPPDIFFISKLQINIIDIEHLNYLLSLFDKPYVSFKLRLTWSI